MNAYEDMKLRHQKEVNEFPNEQFAAGMAKLGLKPDETDKVYKFGNTCGFYLRSDAAKLYEMLDRHTKELKDATEDALTGDDFIYQMFCTSWRTMSILYIQLH